VNNPVTSAVCQLNNSCPIHSDGMGSVSVSVSSSRFLSDFVKR